MTKLNHILAATDLSAPARLGAERAALISKASRSTLTLLHVATLSYLERLRQLVAAAPADLHVRVLAMAHARLRELGDDLARRHGVTPESRLMAGAPLAEMTREIGRAAVDIVICGAKGDSVVRRVLLGSTAQRLLSRAPCPVLVVKQPPLMAYRSVLVPVDFSPSSLQAVRHAHLVAPGVELTLLHVFDVPFEGHMRYASVDDAAIQHYRKNAMKDATRRIQALADEAGLVPHAHRLLVVHGDAALRIAEQEKAQSADLIVMGKHGKGMLEELLVGSVTKNVLVQSQCDVLVSVAPPLSEITARLCA